MGDFGWTLVWVIGSFFINLLGLFINFKIPYYKGKWDRNKKSPIYKIEKSRWTSHYSIYKYKIKYDCYIIDNDFLILFCIFLLPFSCWFHFPYYKKGDIGYGEFNEKDIPNIDFDLGVFWEIERNKSLEEYTKVITKENKEKKILNNLNKDFNKHYGNK